MSVYRVSSSKSSDSIFPKVRPTLDLNFANSKTLDPRITFTRSSGGSYVGADGLIKYAGVNEPRFNHDPVTGESLGLLIEEQRTNLLTNSINFTTGWSNQNIASQIASSSFEFYSGNNVIKIIPNTSITNQHAYNFSANPLTTSSGTFSFFAKSDGYRYVWFRSDGGSGGAVFDLLNGVTSTTLNGTSTIQKYPNNYYRCSFTGSFIAGLSHRIGVSINTGFDGYPTTSFSGDGISGILISTPQLEAGAFPTSYIPTTSATVTRNADVASITGTNFRSWANTNQGTFVIRGRGGLESNQNGYGRFVSFDSTTGIARDGGNNRLALYDLNINVVAINSSSDILNRTSNFSVSFNGRLRTAVLEGNIVSARSGIDMSTFFNQLNLGKNANNSNFLNGTLGLVRYYREALPNSQLQALTR